MRTPPLLADFIHHRVCKPICEKYLTLPDLRSSNQYRITEEHKIIGGQLIVVPLLFYVLLRFKKVYARKDDIRIKHNVPIIPHTGKI